jgi:signal transduction histidine kinase
MNNAPTNILLEIQKHRARQAALREINLALTSTLDLEAVVQVLLNKITAIFPRYAATLRLLDPETGNLGTLATSNVDLEAWQEMLPVGAHGLAQLVFDRKVPVAIADAAMDPRTKHPEFLRENGLVSYLGVPLISRDQVLGVLNLYTRERHEFDNEEIELFTTLGGQAAIAIHNSRLFAQLHSAMKELEKSVEIKSVLMGVMAHELKTLVQVIIGNANLLSEGCCGELTEEQRQRVRRIEAGADELLHLIESALHMTRFEQGKMPLSVTEVPVHVLLSELRSEFEEPFRTKGVELRVCEVSPGCLLKTDRVKLKEILRNLLENARKFTAQGTVKLQFADDRTGQVEFVVEDTGIGIEREALPKIFEPFYQVDSTGRSASAGLGLHIAKRLTEAMSGNIDVTSDVGKGSTFRVVLPKELN